MDRYKKYKTEAALSKAIDAYFNSISRTITLTEPVATKEKDKYGHVIYEDKPIINNLGEEIRMCQYVVAPTVPGLYNFLGITKQTWLNYLKDERFFDAATRARGRIEAYLAQEIVMRKKGSTRGIESILMEEFDYHKKLDVSGTQSVEQFLREHPGGGEDEF